MLNTALIRSPWLRLAAEIGLAVGNVLSSVTCAQRTRPLFGRTA
jgi:hypothetical protein